LAVKLSTRKSAGCPGRARLPCRAGIVEAHGIVRGMPGCQP
jgi:hypothetical protein